MRVDVYLTDDNISKSAGNCNLVLKDIQLKLALYLPTSQVNALSLIRLLNEE